jgi:hypothetical protein
VDKVTFDQALLGAGIVIGPRSTSPWSEIHFTLKARVSASASVLQTQIKCDNKPCLLPSRTLKLCHITINSQLNTSLLHLRYLHKMAPSFEESIVANGSPNDHSNGAAQAPSTSTIVPVHPTRSLKFLEQLDADHTSPSSPPQQAKVKLRIIVVGGGLGGLACAIALARRGHTVTVLEQAPVLGEVCHTAVRKLKTFSHYLYRSELVFRSLQTHHACLTPGALNPCLNPLL